MLVVAAFVVVVFVFASMADAGQFGWSYRCMYAPKIIRMCVCMCEIWVHDLWAFHGASCLSGSNFLSLLCM